MADHGCSVEDIAQVYITHWHTDHAGLAGTVQERSGATVHVHEEDAALVAQRESAWDAIETRQQRLLGEWGLPEPIQEPVFRNAVKAGRLDGPTPTVEPFSAGDTFDCGDYELEAVHLPGHTAGLAGFAFDGEDGRELFCGDALLEAYTPNVGARTFASKTHLRPTSTPSRTSFRSPTPARGPATATPSTPSPAPVKSTPTTANAPRTWSAC
nr:MBL fold metallo-hydrolase [Haladaptatus sp. R4]